MATRYRIDEVLHVERLLRRRRKEPCGKKANTRLLEPVRLTASCHSPGLLIERRIPDTLSRLSLVNTRFTRAIPGPSWDDPPVRLWSQDVRSDGDGCHGDIFKWVRCVQAFATLGVLGKLAEVGLWVPSAFRLLPPCAIVKSGSCRLARVPSPYASFTTAAVSAASATASIAPAA
jgi:hypothetical protein